MADIVESLERMVFSILRDNVATIKPAKITQVDYENTTAHAKPLTKTLWSDDIQTEFDEVEDVPLLILKGGNTRITFPVKVGDLCYIIYSDREYGELLDSAGKVPVDCQDRTPFGNYPIGILAGWWTSPRATPISEEAVEIINSQAKISLKEDELNISVGDNLIDVKESSVEISNGSYDIKANEDGSVTVNGATITSDGRVITASGVDLDAFYQSYLLHIHTGNLGNPTSPPTP